LPCRGVSTDVIAKAQRYNFNETRRFSMKPTRYRLASALGVLAVMFPLQSFAGYRFIEGTFAGEALTPTGAVLVGAGVLAAGIIVLLRRRKKD